ncbi:unnamed protein product [Cladocopium goreaui]|uniref:Uncharacterized protein n=1 Tax=Cladocopium goreaui TaxID=2562237 RepID=A0A9P1G4A0_9DINO|nr:unnamed protein product [Cladocopium goreaui]
MASQKAANLAKIAPDKREQLLVIATKRWPWLFGLADLSQICIVERATLVAWKERVDAAEGSPHPGCIPDALRSPSPRPMISPVERFSPGPLDSPNRRQRVRTRPFEISSRPNAARLSLRPWRHGGADTLESFDEVVAQHRPNTAPTQVTKSAKMRSVEQWLKVLMPVEKDGVSDEAEARQNESRSTARHSEAKNQIERVALDVKQGMPQTPLTEQLRRWCARLALREEVWLEFTLGSLRAECLLLADTMLVRMTMHAGLVAVVVARLG